MNLRDELARQALAIAAEDRVYLADVLERSLTDGGFASSEIGEAWSQEIERRSQAYDRGESGAVDFETALGNIRRSLAEYRS